MSKSKLKPLQIEATIPVLGSAKVASPLPRCNFTPDNAAVRVDLTEDELGFVPETPIYHEFEKAGPRAKIFFEPTKTKCAIVTCGGLCPGLNDVIRAIVMEAHHNYKVAAVLGIRFGLQGFIPSYGHDIMELDPQRVADIHQFGGTILGSSRGPQPADEVVDALERMNISILFMIGGDGTMRAAQHIVDEIKARKLKISLIGIPKTIDNDINFVSRSFGFDTAVEKATEAIQCAHVEAQGAVNGIGLVKVMGRDAGFIAAQATLALKEVNFVLVPENPFTLEGPGGLIPGLEQRLKERQHAVILCAEGAGQDLTQSTGQQDASGNKQLADICSVLSEKIKAHFKASHTEITLKFIDPSYMIRSVPANANDRIYCGFLGQHAVHAAMSGRTGMVVSNLKSHYVHLPVALVCGKGKRLNTQSDYWRAVLESTGQADFMEAPHFCP